MQENMTDKELGERCFCSAKCQGNMTDKELYERCLIVGRNARRWKNEFVALLPEVARRRLYRSYGFCSIYEFAAKLAGVGRTVVDEALRLDSKFEKMPELKALIPEFGVSKLKVIASIAKEETAKFWSEKVENMTRKALETYIKDTKFPGESVDQNANLSLFNEQNDVPESQSLKTQNENKSTFSMQLSEESIIKLRLLKQKLEKKRKQVLCWDEVVKLATDELLSEPEVRIVRQRAQAVQRLQRARVVQRAHGVQKEQRVQRVHNSRNIPARLRREMPKVCEVPGCGRPADAIHHQNRWAITHKHENLRSLCKAHHELEHQKKTYSVDEKMLHYLRPALL
jgi:hypothetical protein